MPRQTVEALPGVRGDAAEGVARPMGVRRYSEKTPGRSRPGAGASAKRRSWKVIAARPANRRAAGGLAGWWADRRAAGARTGPSEGGVGGPQAERRRLASVVCISHHVKEPDAVSSSEAKEGASGHYTPCGRQGDKWVDFIGRSGVACRA